MNSVAVDGERSVKYVGSAWPEDNSLVRDQLKVAAKSNAITALPELLRALQLAGCIVTVDAMGTQKKIAQEIIAADADYALGLKGNHETVQAEVKSFLDTTVAERAAKPARPSKAAASLAVLETVEKDHGRIETRRYSQSAALDWFADGAAWEGLQSIGMVEAIRELGARRPVERRHCLSSLPVAVATFAQAVRGHWCVENKLHWVLDVQMREDQSRARAGYAAENLAKLRRLALNWLKREKPKRRGLHGKQLNASWDHAYLLRLLAVPI